MIQQLRTRLLASPDVSAITTRVHIQQIPQGVEVDMICLHLISSEVLQGVAGRPNMKRATVQVDCYAAETGRADALSLAVEKFILNNPKAEQDGVWFTSSFAESGIVHNSDRVAAGTDDYRFISRQDFSLWFSESE